ncbi:MAG: phosphoribosylglycinamide formyltransferase [Opitutae bacterium]|jgi:phosphoribosylglycinamide formyltransferase 1|nr:phosphoribosylglycinamide formyltransferase [Opitutae bacterium]MBT7742175.1 phosphoribosylglycinamide formyltransferase [Opitutae bacterium]MBT7923084.1 phosphoribosylglycinamide formyltransferase [Opitutae bacterium]
MRVVILGSGSGTNAEAILSAASAGQLGPTQVVAVYSDVQNAGILEKADHYEVKNSHLSSPSQQAIFNGESENLWIETIKEDVPDLIVLAGFMRILKEPFLKAFSGKIINLHPSLLPSFPGLEAIRQAFSRGVKITGCTIHWVNEVVDGGEIIAQAPVRVMPGDTYELLEQKIHGAEHVVLPSVIRDLAIGVTPFLGE